MGQIEWADLETLLAHAVNSGGIAMGDATAGRFCHCSREPWCVYWAAVSFSSYCAVSVITSCVSLN